MTWGVKDWAILLEGHADPERRVFPGAVRVRKTAPAWPVQMGSPFDVWTPEGPMRGKAGDYLLQGPMGERWVVKAEIFAATYEPVPLTEEPVPAVEALEAASRALARIRDLLRPYGHATLPGAIREARRVADEAATALEEGTVPLNGMSGSRPMNERPTHSTDGPREAK